ncbi:MAG: hypothetical protein AAF541_01725 [Pseudomonadota bacterium]
MSRFSAFAIHLGLSLAIFVVLAYLVVFQWYPDFFFQTDGGWRGMRIIIFVDLVLGPMLTLVVYKAGKPGLKTDLTVIGLLQTVCLIAGTWVVYSERPITIVYNDSRFSVLSHDDYTAAGLAVPELDAFPGSSPKWVMVEVPTGVQEEADFRANIIKTGSTISMATQLYEPFDFQHEQVKGAPISIEKLFGRKNRRPLLEAWLAEQNRPLDDFQFYNLASRFAYGALIFDKATGTPVGVIDFTGEQAD